MQLTDWLIVGCLLVVMIAGAVITTRHMRSVADFLAANRCGGRYLLATAEGVASTGAVYIVAMFEMHYSAGFVPVWWFLMLAPISTIMALSGWVVYRFRQTRALTLPQFLEMRYSRKLRIFAGILSCLCGVVNFGIFPAVAARFFIFFCGLPMTVSFFGISVPMLGLVMAILLCISLLFVFCGGQISIMVTDFLQGLFCNVATIVLIVAILSMIDWSQIQRALEMAPAQASQINPFHTKEVEKFNIWFFLINAFVLFYCYLSWQGTQGFNCAALSPHEAQMGKILGMFRALALSLLFFLLPVLAITVMNCQDFSSISQKANFILNGIDNSAVRNQVTVPVTLAFALPIGLKGIFCAMMLAGFISSFESCLHSWGSILIQDILIPLRPKPMTEIQHMQWLRASICGVAVFAFIWGLIFRQTTEIFFYWAVTGTIYLGGSGAIIIGGLYWKRGTTVAAWMALVTGATIGIAGLIIYEVYPNFPVNGQVMWFIGMISSLIVYVLVSLIGKRTIYEMDKLLHRGKYCIVQETAQKTSGKSLLQRLGMSDDFSFWDKVIFVSYLVWTLVWSVVFVVGVIYNFRYEVSNASWLRFWKIYIGIYIAVGAIVTIWLSFGGIKDLKRLFQLLKTTRRDAGDDGQVVSEDNENPSLVCLLPKMQHDDKKG